MVANGNFDEYINMIKLFIDSKYNTMYSLTNKINNSKPTLRFNNVEDNNDNVVSILIMMTSILALQD